MGACLEMNNRHTITKTFSNIQTEHITYKDKTANVIVEYTIYDLYTTLTLPGPKYVQNMLLV